MSKRESIARYNLIIKKVRKHPTTFQEILDYMKRESELQGYNFSTGFRTFQRDLNDIRSIYDIDIQFDRSRKVYYVNDEGCQEANERVIEAYDTFNALSIYDRLSDFIHFENRRSKGTENLYGLLHAIQNQIVISFTYTKYWEEFGSYRVVEPYALKEFKNRWYLVGNDCNKKRIRIFALDRLQNLEISKRKFSRSLDFDLQTYFSNSFGIISSEGNATEEIILSFTPDQGKYIKSLPLHSSQQILIDNQQEILIKLNLAITFDFIMELLSYGADVTVIKPMALVEEMKSIYQAALSKY